MNTREATPGDNQKLQELQAKCPQGKTLIVSIVNTPDFFARAKAYESYMVFVAHEENRIIGSHACAMRNAMVNGKLNKIGYSFQTFISPDHRKKGLAKKLLQYMEDHLIQNTVKQHEGIHPCGYRHASLCQDFSAECDIR
jgi:GNAT superfamily N-acetyltransferase